MPCGCGLIPCLCDDTAWGGGKIDTPWEFQTIETSKLLLTNRASQARCSCNLIPCLCGTDWGDESDSPGARHSSPMAQSAFEVTSSCLCQLTPCLCIKPTLDDVVVNLARREHEAPVCLPRELASKMKPHQIEGVRFIWKHIMTSNEVNQFNILIFLRPG